MRRFCRHLIAALGETKGGVLEAERMAVDVLYPQMVLELFAQNRRLSMDSRGSDLYVYFQDHSRSGTRVITKDRSRAEKVIMYFGSGEVVGDATLEALWEWIRFVFPRARSVSMQVPVLREALYRQEMEAVLRLKDLEVADIYPGIGRSSFQEDRSGESTAGEGDRSFWRGD